MHTSPHRSWPRRLLNRLEVDQAVFYTLVARFWQFVAGPVTMILIAFYFSPQLQGYYYTFASLLAIQLVIELGLYGIVITFASHEWAQLRLDEQGEPVGDDSSLARLADLARRTSLWYGGVSLIFSFGLAVAGLIFLAGDAQPAAWRGPWLALVVLTGISLWVMPRIAILEGCNQVATVSRVRVVQAVTGNLVVWILIPLGAALWTAAAISAVRLAWEMWLVGVRYRRFFRALSRAPVEPTIAWSREVWPLQWRMAVQCLFGYFGHALFTPLLFHYHGPAVAGQMGMTWTILSSLQAGALAWVQTRGPRLGALISRRDFGELDRIFSRVTMISWPLLAIAGAAFWGGLVAANWLGQLQIPSTEPLMHLVSAVGRRIAARLLPPMPAAMFTLAVILFHLPLCQNLYVRAHKVDPFLWLSSLTNLSIGLLVWLWGSRWGAWGAGLGYLLVITVATVPGYTMVWLRCRRGHGGRKDAA